LKNKENLLHASLPMTIRSEPEETFLTITLFLSTMMTI